MQKKIKQTFIVDRAKWVRGIRGQNKKIRGSALRNKQGYMCCLGHCLLQKGFEPKKLRGRDLPGDLNQAITGFSKKLKIKGLFSFFESSAITNTKLSTKAAEINDKDSLTDKDRERKLKALFRRHGYRIKFIGEYAGGEITKQEIEKYLED